MPVGYLSTMLPPESPEFELVRLAARGELSEERGDALSRAVCQTLDWGEVLRLGAYHKTFPLLHAHLREHPEVPENVLAFLRARARTSSRQSLLLVSEMAQIGDRLQSSGVPYLILKGPSLADAYGGLSKRPFVDNDLLIEPGDFGRVERVLLSLGFRERKRSGWQQRGYLYVHGEYTFGRSIGTSGSTVDVHTRLAPFGYAYSPRVATLLERARPVAVAGASVPSPSWEDSFLALSVNALKDQWDRLRLAVDIAEVAGQVEDWDYVLGVARRHRVVRALHLAVLLAHDTVGGGFPGPVLAAARNDARAAQLAHYARKVWRDESHAPTLLDRARLTLLVQDGLRGQLRYAGYTVVRRLTEPFVATTRG